MICRLPRCDPHDTLIIHGKSIPLTEVLLDRDMSVHGKLKEPMFDVSTLVTLKGAYPYDAWITTL